MTRETQLTLMPCIEGQERRTYIVRTEDTPAKIEKAHGRRVVDCLSTVFADDPTTQGQKYAQLRSVPSSPRRMYGQPHPLGGKSVAEFVRMARKGWPGVPPVPDDPAAAARKVVAGYDDQATYEEG